MVNDTYGSYRPKIPNQNFRNFSMNGKQPVCPQRFRKVPFSSVQKYTRKQRFQKVPFSLIVFIGYEWTETVSVKKKLRFQMKTDTCTCSMCTCTRVCACSLHVDRALVQLFCPPRHAHRFHEMQICFSEKY